MKKLIDSQSKIQFLLYISLFLFITFSSLVERVWGQVSNYSFNSFSGVYNSISGTQIVAPGVDDGNSSATNIGFDFVFNGTAFTQFVASSNGCIRLGASGASSSSSAISSTSNSNMIAFFSRDGKAVGGVFYETTGTAPNRVLTIQYTSYAPVWSSTSNVMDAQILLYESSNLIDIIYGSSSTSSSTVGQVGIRGTTASSDYQNRSTSTDWASTIAGTSSSSTVTFSSSVSPVSGLTFRWSPPAPCQSPTDQATNLTFSSISNSSVSASFTAAASAPSGYLVVRSTSATPPTPVDGTTYSSGSTTFGTGTSVVQASSSTSFTNSSLTGNTTYNYYIFSYNNTSCSGGPKYLSASPLSMSTTTCASAPSVSAATSISATGFTANWSASSGGASSYLLYVASDNSFSNIVSGYNGVDVGNVTTYAVTGLSASTSYFYRLIAVGSSCNSANSSSITATTSCLPETAPTQVQDFSTFTGAAPNPICWSEASGSLTSSVTLSGTTSNWTKKTNGFANANSANVGASINLWSNSTNWLITNPIDLGNTAGLYQLKYKYAVTSYNGTNPVSTLSSHKVDLVVSTDGGASWSNANIIKSYAGSGSYSNTGAFETVLLSSYSGVVKIAFVATCISSSDIDFHIDDVQIELAPTCIPPTSLTTSNISYQTATIGWTAPSTGTTPTNYDYEVRTSGAAGSGATGLITSGTVSTTSANISGLTGSSTYSYYVRSSCGNGDYSTWANGSLTTSSCGIPTSVSASSITATSAIISWTAPSGSPSGYEYEIRTSGSAGSGSTGLVFTGTITAPTTSVSLTGLSPANTYFVYIRTICYAGFTSSWTSAYNLVTLCAATTQFNLTFEGSSSLPTCTSLLGGGSVTSTAYEGINCLGISPLATYVLPEVSNYNNNTHQLSFYMRTWSGSNQIAVGYLTDPTDVNTFVSLTSFSISNTYQNYTYTPSNLPSNVYLCLKSLDTYYTNRIDNISWAPLPSIIWSNQAWSNTTGPTSVDNATISDNLSLASNLSCNNLLINSGYTLTVPSNYQLTISGTLTNNGTLTIESGATLVQGASSTLAGTGTYNVQQAITGAGSTTPSGRFWYLGSPVTLASSTSYFGNAANVVKKRDEVNNAWTALSSGTPENLVVGQGYYTQAMANSTINFTGGLVNNGNITINGLTRTAGQSFEGFNLVSNPYPSYLNWDDVTKTNVGGTMWYRTNDGTNMVFDTYVAGTAGGLGTNLGGNMATKWIPPMQSFWVRVNSGSTTGSLGLTNAMRSHFASLGGSTAGLRSTNDELKLFIRMNLLQANKKDQIIVYVNDIATNGFDQYDGEKMMQAGMPQFYTSAAGKKITINGLNSAKKQQALPITMELPTTGVHSFVIEDLEISNGLAWLEDKQEEIMQALEPGTVYEFYANSGINAERFVLHFQLIDNTTPINVYNEVNNSANFSGKGASVYVEAAGVVVIKLPATTEGITDIQIRDAAGKLVYTGSTNILETSVQLAQANGVYYVTLNSASGVDVRKVFIQQ